ncbi:LPS-assembly lipoprotein LptE [Thalassotalea sp. PLHSN55]|uniref:LPS-assembly lipoprotein LptE n=1 Tax=Thalassotalea sp. PLHSN55 TaxID=3435888 RepID=UPI003F82CF53
MKRTIRHIKAVTSFLLVACFITGCGFQLRGDYLLAPELQTLYVSSVDKHGELTRLFKKHLKMNNVEVLPSYQVGKAELRILKDSLDRRTLSVFPNGQVAEYELIYTVRYQIRMEDKEPQNFVFELNRDYQDDPDVALAKSRELNLMLSEMRLNAVDRILRSMASVQL